MNKNLSDWISAFPAFSFRYGGESSSTLLANLSPASITETAPGGSLEHITWLATGGLKITAHLRRFDDSPALDWLLELENTTAEDSPILEDILPLDASLPLLPEERLVLQHANGSYLRVDDFLPQLSELTPNTQKAFAPFGGRSSNGVLPFMNLQRNGGGLVIGVGWSGQWAACFERSGEALRMAAGMERTCLSLHPSEKIRTPRILLIPWEGDDPETGQNALRRLLLAHYLPRIDGELVMPPAAQCLQFYFYLTGQAGERFEQAALPRAAELGTDAYWIDACWFGGEGQWWEEVGTWEVNSQRFPHGLKPISDAAHQAGMQFVLWFEPERARPTSRLAQEHPEFFLHNPQDPANFLFNLGDPEAREYLTDLISTRITEYGVDIYRQDFNFEPLPYWQAADEPDRTGMTEIRHIEGLYAFWDELRRRHPGLWIDNCASGGRRIDLETITRSLPLWPSDFHDAFGFKDGFALHTGDQCINAGLARWVPLFGGGVWNFTPYGTRSEIMGGFMFGFHIDHRYFPGDDRKTVISPAEVMANGKTVMDDDFPMEAARAAIAEWKSIRPYFTGDYHLLLPLTVSAHDWCAWQLHRPDLEAGVAVILRRHASPFPQMELTLKDIDPLATYEISVSPGYEPAPDQKMPGRDLQHLTLSIAEKPGSLLLRYHKINLRKV